MKREDQFQHLLEHGRLPESSGQKRHAAQKEHHLQTACVQRFRYLYPDYWRMLISVPNAGQRTTKAAAWLKAEGMTPGAADLLLLLRRGAYGCLCLEAKTTSKHSRLSEEQKAWHADATKHGNKCVVFRSEEEFFKIIETYLNLKDNETF